MIKWGLMGYGGKKKVPFFCYVASEPFVKSGDIITVETALDNLAVEDPHPCCSQSQTPMNRGPNATAHMR